MKIESGFLKGKKTYLLAALAVASAVVGFAIGELSLYSMFEQIWMGGVAAAIRGGVNNASMQAALVAKK